MRPDNTSTMKIATWNVNSLRVRLQQVLDWSADAQPDLIALQETKVTDEQFPAQALQAAGWRCQYTGQPAYNGVAVLAREPLERMASALPGFEDDARRLLTVRLGDTVLINVYIPNGQSVGSDKYDYKLAWLEALIGYLDELRKEHEKIVVVGDYNIAPEDRDVHDPAAWEGKVLVSEPERSAFRGMQELGFEDSFRLFDQPEQSYSWWDYRQGGFRRNRGLRIDHVLASPALARRCRRVTIDREPRGWPRPSDHTPVVAEFE